MNRGKFPSSLSSGREADACANIGLTYRINMIKNVANETSTPRLPWRPSCMMYVLALVYMTAPMINGSGGMFGVKLEAPFACLRQGSCRFIYEIDMLDIGRVRQTHPVSNSLSVVTPVLIAETMPCFSHPVPISSHLYSVE